MRSQSMKSRCHAAATLLAWASLCVGAAAPLQAEPPQWRVARLAQPPTIDGVIGDAEYADCPALTGMVTYGGADSQGLLAHVQDVTWFMGYDDTHLYLAMRSPHPKGTWPAARVKEMENGEILWDDHTEIQIATRGRKNYAKPGMGFYKIIHNAKGMWRDEWYYNGTPGTEHLWSIGGACKSTVTEERWEMEMAISLAALNERNLDGRSWVMQFVRADRPGGIYFAGWVGAAWMSWDAFGEVVFDPQAPAFRFIDRGETAKGDLDLTFEAVGNRRAEREVTVQVRARDADGRALAERTLTERVPPDGRKSFRFAEKVTWSDRPGNRLEILATAAGRDATTGAPTVETLFANSIPVINLANPTEWAARVDPWLKAKPTTGGFAWRYAYWPYYGVAEASVDLDFFGMPAETLRANAFRVDLLRAGDAKPVASATAPVTNLTGRLLMKPGDLPPGEYVARVQLLAPNGQPVDSAKERPFRRRAYAFERNQLGCERVRLPPWPALGLSTNAGGAVTLQPWNREIVLAPDGLFASVRAGGGAGPEPILTAPIRLEGETAGQPLLPSETRLRVTEANDAQARVQAAGRIGPATFTTEGRMDFDGFYEVTLRLRRGAAGARLDRLTLAIPLWRGADTMWAQRGGDSVGGGNRLGAIPAGTGVVWTSAELFPCRTTWDWKDWEIFVPVVHGGSYDKGVWWFGDNNDDWTSNPNLPTVQYVRTAAGTEIRIHFLAAPAALDRERVFHFALLVDPVKPVPNERREGWGWGGRYNAGLYAHNTFGWREWGRSNDGYYLEEADRTALREMLQGLRPPGRPLGGGSLQQAGANGDRIVLYGSTSNMSQDMPEFDTFSGEWQGSSQIPSDEVAAKPTGFNIGGSFESRLVREQHEIGVNWTQSQIDCFVWYHEKLLRECPVNGTWWDNSSLFVIKDFDADRGDFTYRWNIFARREMLRRLNTIGWRLNRKPWWISNCHVDWSFNQVGWHIENDFYVDGPGNTLLDQLTMDQFRAYGTLRRGLIHRLASRYQGYEPCTLDESRLRARSLVGLCLLHDIGAYLWSQEYAKEYHELPAALHEAVGYFDESAACPFIGYWRSADLVKLGAPGVHASVYKGKDRAALVIMNADRAAKDVPFTLTRELLGRETVRLYDAESRRPIEKLWDGSVRPNVQRFGEYRAGEFRIEGHGLRILVAE